MPKGTSGITSEGSSGITDFTEELTEILINHPTSLRRSYTGEHFAGLVSKLANSLLNGDPQIPMLLAVSSLEKILKHRLCTAEEFSQNEGIKALCLCFMRTQCENVRREMATHLPALLRALKHAAFVAGEECLGYQMLKLLFYRFDFYDVYYKRKIFRIAYLLIPSLSSLRDAVYASQEAFATLVDWIWKDQDAELALLRLLQQYLDLPGGENCIRSSSLVSRCSRSLVLPENFHNSFGEELFKRLHKTRDVMQILITKSRLLKMDFMESEVQKGLARCLRVVGIKYNLDFSLKENMLCLLSEMIALFPAKEDDGIPEETHSAFARVTLESLIHAYHEVRLFSAQERLRITFTVAMKSVLVGLNKKPLSDMICRFKFLHFMACQIRIRNPDLKGLVLEWIDFACRLLDKKDCLYDGLALRITRECGLSRSEDLRKFRRYFSTTVLTDAEKSRVEKFISRMSFRFGNHIFFILENLSMRLNKKVSANSSEQHQAAVDILKTLSLRDREDKYDFGVTAVEIESSGVIKALLKYFLEGSENHDAEHQRSKRRKLVTKKPRKNRMTKQMFSFIKCWLRDADFPMPPLRILVELLKRLIDFSDTADFTPRENHLAANGEIPSCILAETDPRHDALLLLSTAYQINECIPHIIASVNAKSQLGSQKTSHLFYEPSFYRLLPTEFVNRLLGFRLINSQPTSWWVDFARTHPYVFLKDSRRIIQLIHLQNQQDKQEQQQILPYTMRVTRHDLIRSSMPAFQSLCASDVERYRPLNVVFEGELATGPGPATEFFTLICDEFRNPKNGMWRFDAEDGRPLFPRPYHPSRLPDHVISKFRHLGRVMAKAVIERKLLDLPLSSAFYKTGLLGDKPEIYDIASFDPKLASDLLQLRELSKRYRRNPCEEIKFKNCNFEDLCMTFKLIGYNDFELHGDGSETVTPANLAEYVELAVDATLSRGIQAQMQAFREGFNEILDLKWLQLVLLNEMEEFFCGTGEENQWSREMLLEGIDFVFGSVGFDAEQDRNEFKQKFVEILSEFNREERKKFLLFVTASNRLFESELRYLKPRITVLGVSSDASEGWLPTAQTCCRHLWMPNYSNNKNIMRSKLLFALSSGLHSFGFF